VLQIGKMDIASVSRLQDPETAHGDWPSDLILWPESVVHSHTCIRIETVTRILYSERGSCTETDTDGDITSLTVSKDADIDRGTGKYKRIAGDGSFSGHPLRPPAADVCCDFGPQGELENQIAVFSLHRSEARCPICIVWLTFTRWIHERAVGGTATDGANNQSPSSKGD
jgi:hypothetical protein